MNQFQLLDWDTEILGIKTAKILPSVVPLENLKQILNQLKQIKVKLVYWATNSDDLITQEVAQKCGGFLADQKVTYLIDLATIAPNTLSSEGIEIYQEKLPDNQLEILAIEIGKHSRFGLDPKISAQQMQNVYKTWINNSTKKEIAQAVLILRLDNKIIGMVTLANKNNRGDLSLVAVNANYRGLKLGERLVRAAQLWCINQGYQYSQVVTQKTNIAASKLYEKCGYQMEKIENFYHFWL